MLCERVPFQCARRCMPFPFTATGCRVPACVYSFRRRKPPAEGSKHPCKQGAFKGSVSCRSPFAAAGPCARIPVPFSTARARGRETETFSFSRRTASISGAGFLLLLLHQSHTFSPRTPLRQTPRYSMYQRVPFRVAYDTCLLRFLHAENRFGQAPKLRRPQAKIACGLRYSDTVRARTDRHTVIISFSLSANASSICLLNRSVSFCASASPSLAISSGMPFF